jgi:hypothetical protein
MKCDNKRLTNKQSKLTPFCKTPDLVKLNRNTASGRFASDLERDLVEQLGGQPTPGQSRLIRQVVLNSLLYETLCERAIRDEDMGDLAGRQLLAWSNTIRRDLRTLGLDQAPGRAAPRLSDLLGSAA